MFFYKQSSADQVCTNAAGLLTCIILLFGGGQLVCGKSMDRNAYLDLTEMEKEVDAAAVQHAPISTSHFLPWVVSPFVWDMSADESDNDSAGPLALPESALHRPGARAPMERRAVMTSYLLGRNNKRGSFWTGR